MSLAFADGPTAPFAGRPVQEVIDAYRAEGYPFAYSTGLVGPDLRVVGEPTATEPFALVDEILEPHGLTLRTIAGVHLVVRRDRVAPRPDDSGATAVRGPDPEIEMIVVSASRYEIARDISTSRFGFDNRSIQSMPDLGEDPLRVTQRLPGAAASGASARTHFRGGNANEVGIMLNGQWLFDPYHVRDYQSVFSAIDSRAIAGVEVYTGGFPVRYGDRMSGLVLMESIDLEKPRHTEIGLSVFNTSLLVSGASADRRWLFSARRGNLDLIIDPKYGSPSYYDVFGELSLDLSDRTTLSMNALYANDRVNLVLETDPEELEQVVSATSNAQLWVQLATAWSERLASSTVLSVTGYENSRNGSTGDPEKMVASVEDWRQVDRFSFRQDWSWQPSERHFMQWGLLGSYGSADYEYAGSAEYFGLSALYPDQPEFVTRQGSASPGGGSFALYVSDRRRFGKKTIWEWGLRWDDQTYTGLASDAQLSPRINLLYAWDQATEFRLTWGRYYQSQQIQELQIEDGVTRFWPAERSDHLIVGVKRRLAKNLSMRLEGFHKDIGRVRPRFENLYDPLGIIPEFQADRVALAPLSAQATGLELSVDYSGHRWNGWLSYTHSRAEDLIGGAWQARSWDQRHAFQGGATYSDERWTVAVAASVHSGWPSTGLELTEQGTDELTGEPIYAAVPGPRNALRYGNFSGVDFRVSRRFDVRRGSLLVFLEISNLFNRRNECCRDWDVIEDETTGSLSLEKGRDFWLPLLPAVGILWEF